MFLGFIYGLGKHLDQQIFFPIIFPTVTAAILIMV